MLDRFEREINYIRISVTDRCNLRCSYCMPEEGIFLKSHHDIISYENILALVKAAVKLGINKVRLTGGEPLVRKGISHLVRGLRATPGVCELVMTTNGVLLGEMAVELKDAGINRLNISLDTIDPKKYKSITRVGDISHVLRGINAALAAGFKNTKINMVIIPGFNEAKEDVRAMEKFCEKKGLLLQRINHYSLTDLDSINKKYRAERPLSCSECNRIRVTANGKLKPCLFSDEEYDIDSDDIAGSLREAILRKPEHGTCCKTKQNWQIGG
ncbi:MAG: radical SAM protein [Candidatus Aminicenantes bacterium]|nr:radical SAM protein [Candidatus Aminicenantes bacterium]